MVWHEWMRGSDTGYEITIASTTRNGLDRNMQAIKKAAPRSNLSWAYKSKGVIEHSDWQEYPPRK